MKRALLSAIVCLSWIAPSTPLFAQDAVAAAAAREEAEERYRTLAVRVERLEESLHAYQERVTALSKENYQLREELDRLKNRNESAATQESIKRLQDAIKQVDESRLEDNKRYLAEMSRLRQEMLKAVKGMASLPPPPAAEKNTPPPPSANPGGGKPENGYEYTIKKGDTLSAIITALRAQGFKITQKQMEEANPGVNWSKLRIGQKVFVPSPAP